MSYDEHADCDKQLTEAEDKVIQLSAENECLKDFTRYVIRQECWGMCDLDGGKIQDKAEKLGIIAPHVVTKEEVDDESYFAVGDTIFKFSDMLK